MIRVVVLSDSHGDEQAIRRVLRKEAVSVVIHLGDGATEAMRLAEENPSQTWHIVRGNCDYTTAPPAKLVASVGGVRLYLTHGYAEHVKSGLLRLALAAAEQEAAVALYGHTHLPATDFYEGVLLFNPGSVRTGAYGILEIDGGRVREAHHTL